jgi:hypothetical protein
MKGNIELKNSFEECSKGDVDSAGRHYASAMNSHDEALDQTE